MNSPAILLGCIADDLTGATDVAGTLVRAGMRVVQVIGPPGAERLRLPPAEAIVVALKSRNIDPTDAVRQSLTAARWLLKRGCQHIVFKYCSTFNSTDRGNIGPVADALLAELGLELAVVAPSFPRNGRTVYSGYLFVGDELLSESSMRNHPVTPMLDSSVVRMMARQVHAPVGLIPYPIVARGPAAMRSALDTIRNSGTRYVVVDALEDQHLDALADAVDNTVLITGGSAIIGSLAAAARHAGRYRPTPSEVDGRVGGAAAVIAGSCSPATLAQVLHARSSRPSFQVDPGAIAAGHDVAQLALNWARPLLALGPVVIYSSGSPDDVARASAALGGKSSELIEGTLARIGRGLLDAGVRRFVVAGGETSGAVVNGLGLRALSVGTEIAPGVPVVRSIGDPQVGMVLKSGNFGSPTFFDQALEALGSVA